MNAFRSLFASFVSGAVLLAVSQAEPVSGRDSLSKGLIHHWKFDGDAKDSVGRLHGTVVGPVSYRNAVIGQGIVLDGRTTGVTLPIRRDMQFNDSFTLSAWVSLDAYPSWGQLWSAVIFDGDDRNGQDPFALMVGPSGNVAFQINGLTDFVELDGAMPLHRFTLLTGTYDKKKGAMRLYRDGALVAQRDGAPSLTPVTPIDPFMHAGIGIGTSNDFPASMYDFGWNGVIDDLRIYRRALSASEVEKLYALGR